MTKNRGVGNPLGGGRITSVNRSPASKFCCGMSTSVPDDPRLVMRMRDSPAGTSTNADVESPRTSMNVAGPSAEPGRGDGDIETGCDTGRVERHATRSGRAPQ